MDLITNYQRKTIAAHEIGHAYGLGEVWNISQVMYGATPSTSTKVTASDLKGLKLMTHVHSCQDATTYNTYGWVDGTFHRKRCNTCSSFIYEVHTNGRPVRSVDKGEPTMTQRRKWIRPQFLFPAAILLTLRR